MSLIKQLESLYAENQQRLFELSNNEKMHGPFLISPHEKYTESNVKIAFVGQETNGWSQKKDVVGQMKTYYNFNLGKKYRSSPFWNVIRKFEDAINNDQYCSAWLNLNRYDENNKKPSAKTRSILNNYDDILLSELRILKPDVVIFFTGHAYDGRLLPALKAKKSPIQDFKVKQFCELLTDELHAKVYRTYHPRYLRMSKLENSVIETVSDLVNQL